MKRNKASSIILLAVSILSGTSAYSGGFSLKGTTWERAAASAACKPDPLLLYSLALQESGHAVKRGFVAPHPYALRNAPSGAHYPETLDDAKSALQRYIAEDRLTDIGIMQINYRWNAHRVKDPHELLNMKVNIRVAAEILCESIRSNPVDLQLAIGGYHTMNPKRNVQARAYAQSVLKIWRSLKRLNAGA